MDQSFTANLWDGIVKSTFSLIWSFIKALWLPLWPYLLAFFVVVIAGIALQILMRKSVLRTTMSSGFNRLVGSLTYAFFFGSVFLIAYLIWGSQVVDEIWFSLIGIISFLLAGFFLRLIGFWR